MSIKQSLSYRNLIQEKTRFILSVGGITLAVMLILLLNGLMKGLYEQFGAYLRNTPGTVVVSQAGINNFIGSTSTLSSDTVETIQEIDGVSQVIPVLSQFIILDLHDKKQPAYLIGYDSSIGGGPWRISAGREAQSGNEVVFDRTLANRHQIQVNDTLNIMGEQFKVVGLSDGTASWMTSYVFMPKASMETLFGLKGDTSFVLVTADTGVTQQKLMERLNTTLAGVHASAEDEVIANDLNLFARFFSAPLQLMVGIAFLIGTLIVGLIIYTATTERQKEYGVLKAVGSKNNLLYRTVAIQSLIVASLGSLAGVGLTFEVARLITTIRPQFLILIEPTSIFGAVVAGMAMASLGAFFSIWAVTRLSPAEVFRK
ncbi:MAG: ABC transporter permease [Chloroflexota bacterium]|nr:FtsX-like permease family protein [Chloroflexota bacterium]NOG65451.1 FtsX-like permease family protein [Chloroflexota bacterium]GIK64366.1 MAG: ABC transporter permease [Chloroflexota bacterium]